MGVVISFLYRDSIQSEDAPIEYIVTGGLDDLVKVWELQDDKLELKHKLEGHSLGVVSVAISTDGTSMKKFILLKSIDFKRIYFQCVHLVL